MLKTKITELIGIKYPIVGGTMMSITNAEFVAAIANAGGLGIVASAIYKSREEFADAIDRVQELTDKPFAVNINLFPGMGLIENDIYVDVMQEKGVKIVETSGHAAPEDLCGRFKESGMKWIHKCVGLRYARKAESLGADAVTVVGYENGGATGKLDVATMVLVPTVVDGVQLPVIGGGGISDGRGILAVLSLGAEAVIMGTSLLCTKECPIHDNLKKALVEANELDTRLVMRSIGATHRVWNNVAAQRCAEVEDAGGSFEEVINVVSGDKSREMYDKGHLDAGIVSCGQGIGLIKEIPTVQEYFDRIINQVEITLKSFSLN